MTNIVVNTFSLIFINTLFRNSINKMVTFMNMKAQSQYCSVTEAKNITKSLALYSKQISRSSEGKSMAASIKSN